MKELLMMCLFVATLPATAQENAESGGFDYPYLVFTDTEGNEQAFASEGLSMTIEKGALLVTSGNKSTEVSLESIAKMYFSETEPTATGIEDVQSTKNEKQSTIFDLAGRPVSRPAKGLYIVNGKKILVK